MNYRYKIIWTYDGESDLHITYVECKSRKLSSAESAFVKFYNSIHTLPEFSYSIVYCEYLGSLTKKCY